MTHDCAADGHRWGVRKGADALAGRWFWTCIECGHVDLGRPVSKDDLWQDMMSGLAEALVPAIERIWAAIDGEVLSAAVMALGDVLTGILASLPREGQEWLMHRLFVEIQQAVDDGLPFRPTHLMVPK